MEHIIAGRFQTKAKADAAAAAIVRYVDRTDICIFHNNPPGQHGTLMAGGAEVVDPGSKSAGESAVGTALAAGLTAGVIGLVGGPVTALAAAGVAAYTFRWWARWVAWGMSNRTSYQIFVRRA